MAIGTDNTRERAAARQLVQQCVAGDRESARRFQEIYGAEIYHQAKRLYDVPGDQAADFYIYAFEQGRIFRRLQSYAERAPFRTFLVSIVLENLVAEWRRARRTASMLALGEILRESFEAEAAGIPSPADDEAMLADVIKRLPHDKSLLLKLLHAEEYDFTAEDLSLLARVSGHSVEEAHDHVEALRVLIGRREQALRKIEDALGTVHRRIETNETRFHALRHESGGADTVDVARAQERLRQRQSQRDKLIERLHRRKRTTPYRELARVLNVSIGTVSARITRLRQQLRSQLTSRSSQQ